jgi:chemotaxis protein methyltransferase CheR
VADNDVSDQNYRLFSQYLELTCGIVLGDSKLYLVKSRLMPLLRQYQLTSLNELIERIVVKQDRQAQYAAIEAMTTNETLWFRDGYPFSLLESQVLPKFADKSSAIKIWSAACSSGQEAYSIAMTVLNYQKKTQSLRAGVNIVGTDISEEMLQKCRLAEYDQLAMSRGLPDLFKQEYFEEAAPGRLKLIAKVRAMASFRQLNLLDSYSSMGRFDIIFCRNVLIYFSPAVKKQILQKLAACLQDGGILFVGASESISELAELFTMVRCNPGLYYLKKN